ncbi:MAG: METTL5 family protein [Nanoarchaeota archaeon]|nr:METTL5 family protein [Nanoarchaeota archaeon]
MNSQKQLAVALSRLKPFDRPKARLEQYPTDPEIAAKLLWTARMRGDIEGKTIADLGCGTGILTCGALLVGARHVFCVDVDKAVFPILEQNLSSLNLGADNITIINSDINDFDDDVDTVVMNPPFGVQKKHADRPFVERALKISKAAYSIHKAESREFLQGLSPVEVLSEDELMIKATQDYHKRRIHRFKVILVRFSLKQLNI